MHRNDEGLAMTKKVHTSGDNIYADLGFDYPEVEPAKAKLAREIRRPIDARGISQVQAGELIGLDPADVSRIVRGRLGG